MLDILDLTTARVRGLDHEELAEIFERYESHLRFRCPRCMSPIVVDEHPLSAVHADWTVRCPKRDCLVEGVAVLKRPARSQSA